MVRNFFLYSLFFSQLSPNISKYLNLNDIEDEEDGEDLYDLDPATRRMLLLNQIGSEKEGGRKRKVGGQPDGEFERNRPFLGSLTDHVCPEISLPIYAPASEHPPYEPFTFRTSEPRMCPSPNFHVTIKQVGATVTLKFPSPALSDLVEVPRLEKEVVNMNSDRELRFMVSCPDGMTFVCNSTLDKIETVKVFGFSAKLEVKESEVEL